MGPTLDRRHPFKRARSDQGAWWTALRLRRLVAARAVDDDTSTGKWSTLLSVRSLDPDPPDAVPPLADPGGITRPTLRRRKFRRARASTWRWYAWTNQPLNLPSDGVA